MDRKEIKFITIKPRYNKLTIENVYYMYYPNRRGYRKKATARCDCGKLVSVFVENLSRGLTKSCSSCGQKRRIKNEYEKGNSRFYLGEMRDQTARRRLLTRLSAIIGRTTKEGNTGYAGYGGRGIDVEPEWVENRGKFLEYVQTLSGWDEKELSIDRIDNSKGYVKGNIRFADQKVQNRNKRTNNIVEYQGGKLCATDFHTKYCSRYARVSTVIRKLNEGKTPEQIIEEQVNCRGAYKKGKSV